MGNYQKRPIVIQAIQFVVGADGRDNFGALREAFGAGCLVANRTADTGAQTPALMIRTLEGTMIASPGDWVIRGVQGELYSCKPDIFEATYEPVAGAVTIRCDRCGEPFTLAPGARRPRADRRKFCGDWCRQEQRRERQKLRARRHYTPKGVRGGTVLDCARCGEPFTLDSPEASRRGRRRKFCNDSCRKEQARENKKLWKRSHYIRGAKEVK
jgi:hypothetical protein